MSENERRQAQESAWIGMGVSAKIDRRMTKTGNGIIIMNFGIWVHFSVVIIIDERYLVQLSVAVVSDVTLIGPVPNQSCLEPYSQYGRGEGGSFSQP